MSRLQQCLAFFAVLLWVAVSPAHAESSVASSASEGLSASVGSLSNSVEGSSDSSSHNNNRVAEGDYRIVDVAAVAERPGVVRMKLQALAGRGEIFLYVPQGTVDRARLAQGEVVSARQRPYGVEFADGRTRQAFFLALDDEWYRELPANAVRL